MGGARGCAEARRLEAIPGDCPGGGAPEPRAGMSGAGLPAGTGRFGRRPASGEERLRGLPSGGHAGVLPGPLKPPP